MSNGCPFEIKPYVESPDTTQPNIFNLNYTNQDFWSLKSRQIDYARQNFGKEFTDLVESQLAIMLVENFAFVGDTLSFKIDQIANEIFIDTVTEIENGFRLAKLIGFQPQPPLAAKSFFSASINNPILTDIIIPAPLDIRVQSPTKLITVELFPADSDGNPIYDQDIIIPAGNTTNTTIVGMEGRTRIQEISSNGATGQTIQLNFFPVIWDSVRVDVDGVRWTHVDHFTDSQPRREFRVEYDSQYNGYVIFGNNRAGLMPSTGSKIRITYRNGGGIAGNIVPGFVQSQTIVNVPGLGYSVPVNFRNYTKGEHGYDGDTLNDIRQKLPAWNNAQQRAVSGSDYKTLADQFVTPANGSVGKSKAVLRNSGCAGNIIDLYVLARQDQDGLTEASSELKVALEHYFEDIKMFSDYLCIRNGFIVSVDVTIDVVMDKFYRKFEEEYRERIRRRVNRFFSLPRWEYGKILRDTDLIKELSDINESKRFEITYVTDDEDNSGTIVTTKFNEIIRPDVVTISFNYE